MIRVDALSKRFGKTQVLEDLSFDVAPGEILGLGGPNGAGKSVLLRILAAMSRPSAGRVTVAGYDVRRQAREVKRRVGYVGRPAKGYERTSVGEYLAFWASAYRLPRSTRNAIVRDAVELADLEGVLHQPLEILSQGHRQRTELARAVLHDPEVLLLDDPLRGLDALGAADWHAIIRQLAGLGKTVVVASAHLAPWLPICHSVAFLWEGRLAAWGMLEEIAQRYGMPYLSWVCLDQEEDPTEALSQLEGVLAVEPFQHGFQISHTQAPAQLLRELIQNGYPVLEFHQDWSGMERWILTRLRSES